MGGAGKSEALPQVAEKSGLNALLLGEGERRHVGDSK